ncbi:FliO/MopB family protein [Orenia marismortui]|uniref:Flagellar protein FliO/FliZ n=1 Tax=Orenia marismortui TaxID=46469 RepID=A0A4R8H1F1_9FIRM|nr:flagellar biosynthetic protein FliO [Orenia marismortui]TDX51919.1 flagellar protein FliO/FliZ [Orenia marismortui]
MDYTADIFKVLFSLAVVLSIFYLVAKLLKNKRSLFNNTNQIKVLERCYLDTNHSLYLVKVIEKVWLVSVTKENIEFIEEVNLSELEIQEKNISSFFRKDKE